MLQNVKRNSFYLVLNFFFLIFVRFEYVYLLAKFVYTVYWYNVVFFENKNFTIFLWILSSKHLRRPHFLCPSPMSVHYTVGEYTYEPKGENISVGFELYNVV